MQVNGIETQKIEDSNRTILAQNLLNDWANKVWTDNQSTVQNLLTDDQKAFAISTSSETVAYKHNKRTNPSPFRKRELIEGFPFFCPSL